MSKSGKRQQLQNAAFELWKDVLPEEDAKRQAAAEFLRRVRRAYESGATIAELSAYFNVSRGAVSTWLKDARGLWRSPAEMYIRWSWRDLNTCYPPPEPTPGLTRRSHNFLVQFLNRETFEYDKLEPTRPIEPTWVSAFTRKYIAVQPGVSDKINEIAEWLSRHKHSFLPPEHDAHMVKHWKTERCVVCSTTHISKHTAAWLENIRLSIDKGYSYNIHVSKQDAGWIVRHASSFTHMNEPSDLAHLLSHMPTCNVLVFCPHASPVIGFKTYQWDPADIEEIVSHLQVEEAERRARDAVRHTKIERIIASFTARVLKRYPDADLDELGIEDMYEMDGAEMKEHMDFVLECLEGERERKG